MGFVEFGNCFVIALAFLRRFFIKTAGYANSLQMALNSLEVVLPSKQNVLIWAIILRLPWDSSEGFTLSCSALGIA